jgi:hypothetical protein
MTEKPQLAEPPSIPSGTSMSVRVAVHTSQARIGLSG